MFTVPLCGISIAEIKVVVFPAPFDLKTQKSYPRSPAYQHYQLQELAV